MYTMFKFILAALVLVQQVVSFQQHVYRIIHEKVVIEDYNRDFVEDPEITLFKYNETSVAFNATSTIKTDLTNNIWAHVKILQSVNGSEYVPYPAKYSLNICEAQRKDTFGTRDIFDYGNITDCPFKKGTYYVSNYKADETKFPPYVPRGKLILIGKVYDGETFLGSGRWYGTVENI